jgi:hypothetical protein
MGVEGAVDYRCSFNPFFTKSFARKEHHKTAATDFEFFKRLVFLL